VSDNAILGADSRMGDGCTLEANATLEYRAHYGSRLHRLRRLQSQARRDHPPGETVPPSTLVKADGTQLPRYVDIDDYNFRDNDDDREVRVHPDEEPRWVAENPPPAPSPASDAARMADERGPRRPGPLKRIHAAIPSCHTVKARRTVDRPTFLNDVAKRDNTTPSTRIAVQSVMSRIQRMTSAG